MSGAGRGTPRVSPLGGQPPELPSGGGSIVIIPDYRWSFQLSPANPSQGLTGSFASYVNGAGPSVSFGFPAGGVRGLLDLVYTPAAAGSQLEVEVVFLATVQNTGKIYSIPGTVVSPAGGDEQGSEIPISLPVYQTLVTAGTDPVEFGLPFCIPPGSPKEVSLNVREIGTIGGTVNLRTLYVDSFGC